LLPENDVFCPPRLKTWLQFRGGLIEDPDGEIKFRIMAGHTCKNNIAAETVAFKLQRLAWLRTATW